MPFEIKHNKRIKVQGSLETLRGEALFSMIQEEEEEGGGGGGGKLTILLRSIRWTLVVKVLHQFPEHLIIFFIYSIAPLDIIP
jgi:hypothetical protein